MVSRTDLPGISEENSRLRNALVGVVYVFVVLMIIGAAAPAEEDTQPSSDAPDGASDKQTQAKQTQQQQTQAQTEKPTKTQAQSSGYQIRVSYDGEWQGSINADGSSRSVDGSGTETFDIDKDNPTTIAANAQKKDDSGEKLTIEILKDGKVVSEQSTTAEYGMAQTTHSAF